MGDEQTNDDESDYVLEAILAGGVGPENETVTSGRIAARMAREILRRRAANRDLDAISAGMMAEIEATPEIKTALVKEMAAYRLMAGLGVRELRWTESEIGQLYAKISPAATEVNDRYTAAIAADAALNAEEGVLLRARSGIASKVLLEQHRREAEVVRKLGEAALEFERIVLPEIVMLIEAKERSFQAALTKEKPQPVGPLTAAATARGYTMPDIHANVYNVVPDGVTDAGPGLRAAMAAVPKLVRTKLILTNISLHDSKDSPRAEFAGPCQIKIGKASTNHVTVFGDVARLHAVIEIDHTGKVTICDMGSPFGTFVNGKAIRLQELKSSDVIGIGSAAKYRVTFEVVS